MTVRRALVYVGLACWLCGILATFALVWRYKLTPGPVAHAPEQWPAGTAVRPARDVANVVFVAHPHCPCTTASMTELARLADELRGRAKIHVLIVRPRGAEPGFENGAIKDRAEQLGADVVIDIDGRGAERFGAIVSGSTIVYAADGTRLFRGGLTNARGHEGRGPAHDLIVAAVNARQPQLAATPTFGCALETEDSTGRER